MNKHDLESYIRARIETVNENIKTIDARLSDPSDKTPVSQLMTSLSFHRGRLEELNDLCFIHDIDLNRIPLTAVVEEL